jgi:hypothetical protein
VKDNKVHQTPDTATGQKLAADFKTDGLWEMDGMTSRTHLCRRSIGNLLKKGLPHIKLGRRILFHPPSVEAWLLRQQQGGNE